MPQDKLLREVIREAVGSTPIPYYQVTYRISGETTPKGTARARYKALTNRLATLKRYEKGGFEGEGHTSTSAWIVQYSGTAQDLFDLLKLGLSGGYDLLEVIEVVVAHHVRSKPVRKV